jgi:RNase P/RNase MRP subunit p30
MDLTNMWKFLSTALFTVAALWNQLRHTSINERIKKMSLYTMENYSSIKNNEIMLFAEKWMELEIILSEINQTEKDKYLMFSL